MILFFLYSFLANASDYTSELKKSGELKISESECQTIEKNLGQTFYATLYMSEQNKDGNNQYVALVKDLNLGGVLPHFRTDGNMESESYIKAIYDFNKKVRTCNETPTLVGVDYIMSAGLGYGKGVLGNNAIKDCPDDYYALQSAMHSAFALNHALGPTVEHNENNPYSLNQQQVKDDATKLIDQFNKNGVATTLKHFPYTPSDYNLHLMSADSKLSKSEVEQKLKSFANLAGKTDFVMSTHLYNSSVDKDDMATFSPIWVKYLREYAGFQGILMTDAIFMISHYKSSMIAMSRKWNQEEWSRPIEDQSIFAIRALLSGHDMVFLDGNYLDTRKLFKEVLYIACSDHETSKKLRERILESSKKVLDYKQKNLAPLSYIPDYNKEFLMKGDKAILLNKEKLTINCKEVKEALKLYQAKGPSIKHLTFPISPKLGCGGDIQLNSSQEKAMELIKDIEKIEDNIKEETLHN